MRILSLILVFSLLVMAAPAMAGKVSYADGKGKWVPTSCELPRPPASLAKDSAIPANDLNARMAAHNAFVSAAEAFMDCVGKEAQRDADVMSQMIVNSAQELMANVQADVQTSATLVSKQ